MTSNKAVAEAVRLAKPQVIPVYPITPQTTISEYLAYNFRILSSICC